MRRYTMVQQVYDALRERIIQFALEPGTAIDVKGVSQELEVSQTPVREALQKLVEEGLVVSNPYVGYSVVRLTAKDVRELFDLRKAVEVLALRYAFGNIDQDHVHSYLERLERMERQALRSAQLIDQTHDFDRDLHIGLIIEASKSRWLVKYANGIIGIISLSTRLSLNPRAACAEHRSILEAIAAHDLEGAVARLEDHLERSKQDAMLDAHDREVKQGSRTEEWAHVNASDPTAR